MPEDTVSPEIHPIAKAMRDEIFAALKERRTCRAPKEIKAQFSVEMVADYEEQERVLGNVIRRRQREEEEEKRRSRIDDALRNARIPERFAGVSFDSLEKDLNESRVLEVRRYIQEGCLLNGRRCLMLSGEAGNGKTTVAAAALRECVFVTGGQKSARFWNLTRGLQAIRTSIEHSDQDYTPILELCRHHLLVIDDVGKLKLTEWAEEQFYTLVDSLYAENRSAIFTTNWTGEQIFERLDRAVVSRLADMCEELVFQPNDYRLS